MYWIHNQYLGYMGDDGDDYNIFDDVIDAVEGAAIGALKGAVDGVMDNLNN